MTDEDDRAQANGTDADRTKPDGSDVEHGDAGAIAASRTVEIVRDDPLAAAGGMAAKLERALRSLTTVGVDNVFAAPTQVGNRVIITAASVKRQGGFGFGAGAGLGAGSRSDRRDERDVAGQDDTVYFGGLAPTDERNATSGGGGGGGGVDARPVAVITVDDDGVHIKPILDMTKIGLSLLTAALTIWRTLRKS